MSDLYGPIDCHPHDKKWIYEELQKIPAVMRKGAIKKYSHAYRTAHDEHPYEISKDGAARREANTRLRMFIDKITRSLYGTTISPGE